MEPLPPVLRPSCRDDPRSTLAQARWQTSPGAGPGPDAGQGTRPDRWWCHRCRGPPGGPGQHRCGGRRVTVPLPQQFPQVTVAVRVAEQVTCAEPVAEQVAVPLTVPQQVTLAEPVTVPVQVAVPQPVTVPVQVALPQPVTVAEQDTVPEQVAVPQPVTLGKQVRVPEPVA
jgi:hypothetical protein